MSKPGVLMIHGLGGTSSDFGSLFRCLEAAGFCVEMVNLPGHGGSPEDLLKISVADWTHAVRLSYLAMQQRHDVVHVVGMCMGALLAIEVAKDERPHIRRPCHASSADVHRRLVFALV